MSDDGYIDHAKLQQRYLVHYDTGSGSRFGIDVWSTLRQAEADADGFREDGMQARVIKVTVENGGVVAQWCTGVVSDDA